MRSEAAGVLPEAFWSPFGPLIHRPAHFDPISAPKRQLGIGQGDQRGTNKNPSSDMTKPR